MSRDPPIILDPNQGSVKSALFPEICDYGDLHLKAPIRRSSVVIYNILAVFDPKSYEKKNLNFTKYTVFKMLKKVGICRPIGYGCQKFWPLNSQMLWSVGTTN